MLKRSTRIGLLGAVAIGASALALWACAPAPVGGGTPNNNPVVTPASQLGQVKVAIQLPSDSRQVQAVLDVLNSIDLSVTSANWSPPRTVTFSKADLSSNTASKTFTDVPAGAATVKVVAKDSAGAEMATDTADITVVAGSTVYASMKLTLLTNSGVVSATITIEVTEGVGPNLEVGKVPAGQLKAQNVYVGAGICMTCHSGIAAEYKPTAHYKGGRVSRASCTACHATGGIGANGANTDYPDATMPFTLAQLSGPTATDSAGALLPTADFMRVGCESCHGPGGEHVKATYSERFNTITRVPDYKKTCANCHTGEIGAFDPVTGLPVPDQGSVDQEYKKVGVDFPDTGVPESVYMARGSQNQPGMSAVTAAFDQKGGYTGGVAVTFTNAHKTKTANGCVSCHMAGLDAKKHTFEIASTTDAAHLTSTITNSCQKCHGSGFNEESITSFQGQTKLAITALKDALVAYRAAFATKVYKPAYGTTYAATESVLTKDVLDISRDNQRRIWAPSLWDDSTASVVASSSAATAAGETPKNWTDKANWTDGSSPWSEHQKIYNRAWWNFVLVGGELYIRSNGAVPGSEGSFGIHAPTYTQHLIQTSYNEITAVLNAEASGSYKTMSLK